MKASSTTHIVIPIIILLLLVSPTLSFSAAKEDKKPKDPPVATSKVKKRTTPLAKKPTKVKVYSCVRGKISLKKVSGAEFKKNASIYFTSRNKVEEFCGFCSKDGKVTSVSTPNQKEQCYKGGRFYKTKALAEKNSGWCIDRGKIFAVNQINQCKTKKLYATRQEAKLAASKLIVKKGFCNVDGKTLVNISKTKCRQRKGDFHQKRIQAIRDLAKKRKVVKGRRVVKKESLMKGTSRSALMRQADNQLLISPQASGTMAQTQVDVGPQASTRPAIEIATPAAGDSFEKPATLQIHYRVLSFTETRPVFFYLYSASGEQIATNWHRYQPVSLEGVNWEDVTEITDFSDFNLGSEGESVEDMLDATYNSFDWPLGSSIPDGMYYLEAQATTPDGFGLVNRTGLFYIGDEEAGSQGVIVNLRDSGSPKQPGELVTVDLLLLGNSGPGFPATAYPMDEPILLFVHPANVGNAESLEGMGFWHQFAEMELVRTADYRQATITARLPESLVPADNYIVTYIHRPEVHGSSSHFTIGSELGAIKVLVDHRDNEYHFLDNPFSIDWQVPHTGGSLPIRWNIELLKETTVGNFEYQLHFTTWASRGDSFFSGGLDWTPYVKLWTPGNKITPGKYKVKVSGIGSDLEGTSEVAVHFGERQDIEVISPVAGVVRTLLSPLTARFRVPAGGQGPFDVDVNCGIGLNFSLDDVDCPECPAIYPQDFETGLNRFGGTPEMINAVPVDGSLECKIQVTSETDPDLTGEGEPFNVVLPEFRVLSPAAGVTWRNGDEHLITWDVGGSTSSSFNIQVKSEPPGVLHTLASGVTLTPAGDREQGQYRWIVGYPTGGEVETRERGGAGLDGGRDYHGSATLAAYLDLPAGAYRILITNSANHGWQAYSEVFNIVDE